MEYSDWSTDESESVKEGSEEIHVMPYVRRLMFSGQCCTLDALIGRAKDMSNCNNRNKQPINTGENDNEEKNDEDDVDWSFDINDIVCSGDRTGAIIF